MAGLHLEGIRVVDITVVWAGPFATQLMADWGAEVIRIESCQHWMVTTRGYEARPPQSIINKKVSMPWLRGYPGWKSHPRSWNRFPFFNAHARNKLSMTVDLTRPEGMDIFKRLIGKADIFLENNGPDAMDALGITYEMMRAQKPDIIMIRMPAYGLSGPYRNYRSYGWQMEHTAGLSLLRSYRDMDATSSTAVYHCDAASAAMAAFAAITALHHRDRTGRGQFIEVAQVESLIGQLGESVMDYVMNGRVQHTVHNWDPAMATAPHNCYRCRGDDRWVNIAVGSEAEWHGLCRAMGDSAWTKEERFRTTMERIRNQDELDKLMETWTLEHDHIALMHLLQAHGVPAGAVFDGRDAFNCPHLKDRGYFEPLT